MPVLYSPSRLNTFENCPKQFHFRYVLGVPAESESIEAFVGKRVHEVLERLYLFLARGHLPTLPKILDRYRALFYDHYDATRVRIVREGTPLSFYQELGIRCLSNYYRTHYPFDTGETIGLEKRVVFPLDPEGKYRIQGIVDRITRMPDGVIEVVDYKTGKAVPSQKKLDKDRQLALYQLGLIEEFGRRAPMRLVWHYVARGETRTSTRSRAQLQQLRDDTIGLIQKIESETTFATRKTALCGWCEYKSLCPAWASPKQPPAWVSKGIDAAEAPPRHSVATPPPPVAAAARPLPISPPTSPVRRRLRRGRPVPANQLALPFD